MKQVWLQIESIELYVVFDTAKKLLVGQLAS